MFCWLKMISQLQSNGVFFLPSYMSLYSAVKGYEIVYEDSIRIGDREERR